MFWVYAGTKARAEESFRGIADALKLPGRDQPNADIMNLIKRWLSTGTDDKWFIILDSVDDYDVFYNTAEKAKQPALSEEGETRSPWAYIPQSPNGSVLITTQDKELAFRLTPDPECVIDVGPMDSSQALGLLEQKLRKSDIDAGQELVKALEFIPLAISQAAAYIQHRSPRTSVKEYLRLFQENETNKSRLMNYDEAYFRRDESSKKSISATFHMSFDYIHSKRQSAANVLSLMSFFDCQGIPQTLILSHVEGNTSSVIEKDSFEDDIAMLRKYCLVTVDDTGKIFKMHGLVQVSARYWLEAHKETERFKEYYIDCLANEFPDPSYENWKTCRKLLAHVEGAINYPPVNEKSALKRAVLLHDAASFAMVQGRYIIAGRMAHDAHTVLEKTLGKEDKETLETSTLLGLIRMYGGSLNEAESLLVSVKDTRQKLLGDKDAETVTSKYNLAMLYSSKGQHQRAEKLEVQILETRKTSLGKEHPDTLASTHNLAHTYMHQKRWDKAEPLVSQVMEVRRKELGPGHPVLLTAVNALVKIYLNQGRWKEAESLASQAISETERQKTMLGEVHPDMLSTKCFLAEIWKSQGKVDKAINFMNECIEELVEALGSEHPHTKQALSTLDSWRSEGSKTS